MAHFFSPMDYMKIILIPFVELLKALIDQSHFHIKSFFYYANISRNILINFILYCFIFYYTQVCHLFFLKRIGFLGHKDLENDSGSFELFEKDQVWCPDNENIGGIYNNITGNIAHCPISSMALDKMMTQLAKLVDIKKTVFVDFGCGSGFPCMYSMLHPFQDVVGIELHEESARLAEANLQMHLKQNANKCLCPNFRILCQDMQTFDFSSIVRSNITTAGQYCSLALRPAEIVVLYLYEPLWTLSKSTAFEIYQTVLLNALYEVPSDIKEIYFVYLFAGMYGGDALSAFNAIKQQLPDVLELVCEETYFGLFFGYSDNLYIYKATLSHLSDADRLKRKESRESKAIVD